MMRSRNCVGSGHTNIRRSVGSVVEGVEQRRLLASVAGTVFADSNRNTRRDHGEAGAAGGVVYADYNYNGRLDAGEPSTVSGPNGAYALDVALRPFALSLQPAPDTIRTAPTGAGVWYYNLNTDRTDIVGWGSTFGIAPASIQSTAVSGRVYIDANRNGLQDAAEYATFRIPVFADYNNNASLDANEPSTVTDDHGNYTVNVAVRAFALRIVAPQGYLPFSPASGAFAYTVASNGSLIGAGSTFSIATDQTTLVSAILEGHAFYDTDGDGWLDAGEAIAGAGHLVWNDINRNFTFESTDTNATTDATGFYSMMLTGAPFDMVSIQVTPAAGYVTSIIYNHSIMMRNIAGQTFTLDIALRPVAATVSGTVFADTNRDGRRDGSESALAGRSVFADYNYNGLPDVNEPAAITDANGLYSIATRGSNVSLKVVLTAGEAVSLPYGATNLWLATVSGTVAGKNIGIVSTVPPTTTTITGSGYLDTNRNGQYDAGDEIFSLGGLAYFDLNDNGIYDGNDLRSNEETPGQFIIRNVPVGARHAVRFLREYTDRRYFTDPGNFGTRYLTPVAGNNDVGRFGVTFPGTWAALYLYADSNSNGRIDADEPEVFADAVWVDLNRDNVRQADEPTFWNGYVGASASLSTRVNGNQIALPPGSWHIAYKGRNANGQPFSGYRDVTPNDATPRIAFEINTRTTS